MATLASGNLGIQGGKGGFGHQIGAVTQKLKDSGAKFGVSDARPTHTGTSEAGVLKRVFLLSPGYVNGSDSFQLDALESVCSSSKNPMNMLFNLTDGRSLHFSLGDERLDESQYTDQVFKRTPEPSQ